MDFQVTANPFLAEKSPGTAGSRQWMWEQFQGTGGMSMPEVGARGLVCPLGSCLALWRRQHLVGDPITSLSPWPPALPKLHRVLAWLLFSPARKTLGAKVKSHRLHRLCGEAPAPPRVRLAPPRPCSRALLSPHGGNGLELSPSSCHLRGHFIPDTVLSPAHSRDIQPGPTPGKAPRDTILLCPGCAAGQEC